MASVPRAVPGDISLEDTCLKHLEMGLKVNPVPSPDAAPTPAPFPGQEWTFPSLSIPIPALAEPPLGCAHCSGCLVSPGPWVAHLFGTSGISLRAWAGSCRHMSAAAQPLNIPIISGFNIKAGALIAGTCRDQT